MSALASTIAPPRVYTFGEIEIPTFIGEDGEPWFAATGVCAAVGISNASHAIAALDDDEKGVVNSDPLSPGGSQKLRTVSEPGLYSLILRSRKPEAKGFKRWITHEVLPAIRREGRYGGPRSFPEALRMLAAEVEAKEALAAHAALMVPKAEFYDAVTASSDVITMNVAAKLLGTGRNLLLARLRADGIFMANNLPYQRFLDASYFRVVETPWKTPEGETRVTPSARCFQKGLDFLRRHLKGEAKEGVGL